MIRKFSRYFAIHPVKCFIYLLIIFIAFTMLISRLPTIFCEIFAICLTGLMIVLMIIALYKEKKEKQILQSMDKEDYEKKWKQYINLVNEVIDEKNHKQNKLNTDWIQTFNEAINIVATNQYLLRRMFNDFDIAACLIYSLTSINNTDEGILFAFDCAKKVINEPKEYILYLGYGYKLELEVEKELKKIKIYIPDETITPNALTSIIRAYLTQNTANGILQLSDFLHILYLKCK